MRIPEKETKKNQNQRQEVEFHVMRGSSLRLVEKRPLALKGIHGRILSARFNGRAESGPSQQRPGRELLE